jgi:hypothetical protein
MIIMEQIRLALHGPVPLCYFGFAAVYVTVAVASWRMRHRVHALAYLAAAALAGTLAALFALAQ